MKIDRVKMASRRLKLLWRVKWPTAVPERHQSDDAGFGGSKEVNH